MAANSNHILMSVEEYLELDRNSLDAISCDPHSLEEESDIIYYPRVIIEVLSPSTEAYDRGKKFTYYRSCASIQEYVLISTQEQTVDVYRRATDNLWTLHPFRTGDVVTQKSIAVSIPRETLNGNVTFPEDFVLPDIQKGGI